MARTKKKDLSTVVDIDKDEQKDVKGGAFITGPKTSTSSMVFPVSSEEMDKLSTGLKR